MSETPASVDVLTQAWARVREAEDRAEQMAERRRASAAELLLDRTRQLDFVRRVHHDALLYLARTNADLEQRLEKALRKFAAAEDLRRAIRSLPKSALKNSPLGKAVKEYDRVEPPPVDKILARANAKQPSMKGMVEPSA